MKKLLLIICVLGLINITACGPSAEEKAKMETATQDSIKAADDAMKAAEEAAAANAAAAAADTSSNKMMDTTAKAK